jgi:DNA-binding protein H-NS
MRMSERVEMAKTDLSDYNLGELKGLQFDIENEIRKRRADEVNRAREEIMALAHGTGLSVDELLLNKVGKPKRKQAR